MNKLVIGLFTAQNWGKLGLELLVVFLGITSGFFLNNWQEREREEKIEQKYLKSFHKDVEDNIEDLEEAIEADSIWILQAKPIILKFQEKKMIADSTISVISKISQFNRLESHSGTYEDITNSGNLNLISNFVLKTKIIDYNLSIEGTEFLENHFYNYFNDVVIHFIFDEYSVLTNEFKNKEVYKSMKFSNVFAGYYSYVVQRYTSYKELLVESHEFKQKLDAEIVK